MIAWRRALSVIASLAAIGVAFSCGTFSLPSDTCGGDSLNAKTVTSGSGEITPDPACTSCLQDHCCDDVGHCERDSQCASEVNQTQACVLGFGLKGAQHESDCIAKTLDEPLAKQTYQCMRDNCGDSCGLPVCQVDRSVGLFVSPTCDGCLASSCCKELNDCAGNRACLLTLDCISTKCGPGLGSAVLSTPISDVDQTTIDVCASPLTPDASITGPTDCITQCVDDYRNYVEGPIVDPSLQPGCLSYKIFACAVRANCGPECTAAADAGSD